MKYAFEFTAAARSRLWAIDQTTVLRIVHALSRLGDDLHRRP